MAAKRTLSIKFKIEFWKLLTISFPSLCWVPDVSKQCFRGRYQFSSLSEETEVNKADDFWVSWSCCTRAVEDDLDKNVAWNLNIKCLHSTSIPPMDCLTFREKQTSITQCSITRMKVIRSGGSQGKRIYYSNSTACYRLVMLLLFDIEVNPGPQGNSTRSIHELKCLYLNSRSIVNKTKHLEALAESKEYVLITITETWLNNSVSNNALLLPKDYCIHSRDRELSY